MPNCSDRTQTTVQQFLTIGFKKYKSSINNQWENYNTGYKNAYHDYKINENGSNPIFKCYKANINNILDELNKLSKGIDTVATTEKDVIEKKSAGIDNTKMQQLVDKTKNEKSKNLAAFPMKQDIYDLNSKEYLYFSFYIMSIFTMVYFMNIQIRK